MSTSSDFLIDLAGRLHHEPEIARRLAEIAHELRRLHAFADGIIGDALADAREMVRQARDTAANELNRICRDHARDR